MDSYKVCGRFVEDYGFLRADGVEQFCSNKELFGFSFFVYTVESTNSWYLSYCGVLPWSFFEIRVCEASVSIEVAKELAIGILKHRFGQEIDFV